MITTKKFVTQLVVILIVTIVSATRAEGTSPVPDVGHTHCSLTIWDTFNTFDNVTRTRINVREGATVKLSCEFRCTLDEAGDSPVIQWYGPSYMWIRPYNSITRKSAIPGESRRLKDLYVKSFRDDDIGIYRCHAKGVESVHVQLDMEDQAEEFKMDLDRGESRDEDQ